MRNIPRDERQITDQDVFEAFDLSLPQLSSVRQALEQKDLAAAKKELVYYFEKRTLPVYFFDYRSLPLQKIDTDSCPRDFQSSMGLSGSLKEFCLYAGKQMMEHYYVRPGKASTPIYLGEEDEDFPHFNFLEDMGKRPRAIMDIFVRGPVFEYLAVLYHETGDKKVLARFEEVLYHFFQHYPLVLEYTEPDASRFSFTDEYRLADFAVHQYVLYANALCDQHGCSFCDNKKDMVSGDSVYPFCRGRIPEI